MVSKPKAPAPINVGQVTQQANQQNTGNAQQQAAFNRPNQTNQYGSTLNYTQTGTDANGNPVFSQNQQLGSTGQQFAGGFANLGNQYFQGADQFLNNQPDLSNNAAFDKAYGYASANLEPRYQQQSSQLESKLRNQGLDPTSEAYKSATNDLALQQNESRNNLVSQLQGQMFNQGQQDRTRQVGELTSLTNPGVQYGGQSVTGGFANVPGVNVANVDVAGLNNANYQQQYNNYLQQMQSYNGMLGGLAGLGGSLLTAPITGGTSVFGGLAKSAMPSIFGQ